MVLISEKVSKEGKSLQKCMYRYLSYIRIAIDFFLFKDTMHDSQPKSHVIQLKCFLELISHDMSSQFQL